MMISWKAGIFLSLVAFSAVQAQLGLDCQTEATGALACKTEFTPPPIFHSCVEEWVCFQENPAFCPNLFSTQEDEYGALRPDGSLKITLAGQLGLPTFFALDVMVHDKGLGDDTKTLYQFFAKLNVLLELFPNQSFEFNLKAKLHGTSSDDYQGRGAYDNAKLNFKVRIEMGDTLDEIIQAVVDGFEIKCQQSPFKNLLEKEGPGVGDQFNKYAWSMLHFNDDLYVGTWKMQIDYSRIPGCLDPECLETLSECLATYLDLTNIVNIPSELLEFLACIVVEGDDPNDDNTGSEIWQYNHRGGQWTKVLGGMDLQGTFYTGFRKMVEYNGKIYALGGKCNYEQAPYCPLGPSLWGAFGTTVLLRSATGEDWEEVPCTGVCPFNDDERWGSSVIGRRSMAVYAGKLYMGLETGDLSSDVAPILLSLDDSDDSWASVSVNPSATNPPNPPISVSELAVFDDKLWVGTQGNLGFGVYTFDESLFSDDLSPSGSFTGLEGTQFDYTLGGMLHATNNFVMKMYEHKNQLYVSTNNFFGGFSLLRYSTSGSPELLSGNGFGSIFNNYAWNMQEFQGRLLVGTFNRVQTSILTGEGWDNPVTALENIEELVDLKGDAELWMLNVDGKGFQKIPLPLGLGLSQYGIRSFAVRQRGNNEDLYIGTASALYWPYLEGFKDVLGAGFQVFEVKRFHSNYLRSVAHIQWPDN